LKFGTAVVLTILGSAAAGVAAYLSRGRSDNVRLLAAGLAFGTPWLAHAALSRPNCSFLFISDTHGPVAPNRVLAQTMLTESDISFVVHGGDVADNADLFTSWWDSPFADVINEWAIIGVPGNHDISTSAGAAEQEERFGLVPRSYICGEAELFLMPWTVTRETAEWLWAAVQRSQAHFKILVIHKPVWPVHDDDARQRDLLMPVLDRIDLVLSGHDHVFQDSRHGRVRQIIETSGPKKYECPASASGCVADTTGYIRVDVMEDGLRVTRKVIS
jgi:predicted phosphodiesterase